ncbi:MAG: IgA Peptidase M64 [Bacteroidales bacterium]|nr:IgA Peptidase M64 [Bacteroidales bacterium]
MKNAIFLFLFLLSFSIKAQINFDDFFIDKSMRFDYNIGGNNKETRVFYNKLKEEPFLGGSKINLIDTFNLGDFRIKIFDAASNKLIYSRGYSTLYYEWIDTEEAKTTSRSFYESVTFPFPKNNIMLKIEMRKKNNSFVTLFETEINPGSISIIKDKQSKYKTQKLHYSGNHHKKLDIVIIPDGYTKEELNKFHSDSKRFIKYFFETEPFKTHKNKVNFWAVDAISEESGTDIPGSDIWKNTVINTHFYTFGWERYLTTQDIDELRNVAAYVPYDQIYILVNTSKYGGGGIYNYYNLCSADNEESGRVFTHEFGHAFAALADEYQYGYDKAEDIYDMKVEPWQVNITNLVNFKSKWKELVKKTTPMPTPDIEKNKNLIGAFEGAGYVKKGIYRPAHNCKMRSNNTDEFCPVCYGTVLQMLLFYSE